MVWVEYASEIYSHRKAEVLISGFCKFQRPGEPGRGLYSADRQDQAELKD